MTSRNFTVTRVDTLPAPTWAPMPGVDVERHRRGGCLVGSREALQRHPDCPAGMFDGEGETWKAQRTIKGPDSRTATVTRIGRRYRMTASTTDEQRAALEAQRDKARETERALAEAKERLGQLVPTAAAYRSEALTVFEVFIEPAIAALATGTFGTVEGGFRLNGDACNTVGIHLQGIRAALETETVVFDPQARRAVIDKHMAKARNADPAFAQMMSSVLSADSPGPESSE